MDGKGIARILGRLGLGDRPAPAGDAADLEQHRPGSAERYLERGEIGRGGMGTVRRVHDRSLRREIALKQLDPGLSLDDDRVRRFVVEARITGQLDHPNIVPIHELDRGADGGYYFTMKLIEGESLAEALATAGDDRLRPDRLAGFLETLIKVCDAVAFAHSRGVIHRDIKPGNIMVGQYGQVYLTDWGVALVLEDGGRVSTGWEDMPGEAPGSIVGSPAFMAPEQIEGDPQRLDRRTDVFALGATLYNVLTGRPPYVEKNYFRLLNQALGGDFPTPSQVLGAGRIHPRLERIALRAMAKDPAARYPTVLELKVDLERFLRGAWNLPVKTYPAGSAIITEGEEASAAYLITAGRCRVIKKMGERHESKIRDLGPGEVFGETAIFSNQRRTATVEALDEVTVLVVDRETLSSGLGLDSWLGRFVKALAERFLEVDERLGQYETAELRRIDETAGSGDRGG